MLQIVSKLFGVLVLCGVSLPLISVASASVSPRLAVNEVKGHATDPSQRHQLDYEMALDAEGRFKKIVLTIDGEQIDALSMVGAEHLKPFGRIDLSTVIFSYEGLDIAGQEIPHSGEQAPRVGFSFMPGPPDDVCAGKKQRISVIFLIGGLMIQSSCASMELK